MTYRALTKDKPALHCHSTERRTHLISAYSVCTLIARPHFLSNRPAEIKQRVTAYKLSNGVIRTTIINTLRAFKLLSSPVSICFRSCFKISPPVALVSRCFRSCFNLISPPVALVSILFQSVGFPHQLPLFRSCFNLSDFPTSCPCFDPVSICRISPPVALVSILFQSVGLHTRNAFVLSCFFADEGFCQNTLLPLLCINLSLFFFSFSFSLSFLLLL